MFDSNRPFIEFCCMGHEAYFTEDFQSDDDDVPANFDYKSTHSIKFMPEPYEDIQKELLHSRFNEEISTQCDFTSSLSIQQLSQMPAYSCDRSDKILTPNPINFSITHTAKAFFPFESLSGFECKSCNLKFKSMRGLQGHNARKH